MAVHASRRPPAVRRLKASDAFRGGLMATTASVSDESAVGAAIRVLEALTAGFPGGVAARFWTGRTWQTGPRAGFTLVPVMLIR